MEFQTIYNISSAVGTVKWFVYNIKKFTRVFDFKKKMRPHTDNNYEPTTFWTHIINRYISINRKDSFIL